jgi:hypothetical protein
MENEVIPDLDVETQREVAIEMEIDVSPSSVTPICTSPAPVQSRLQIASQLISIYPTYRAPS